MFNSMKGKSNLWAYIGGGILLVVVILLIVRGVNVANQEKLRAETEARSAQKNKKPDKPKLSDYEKEQIRLIKRFGTPPEGFRYGSSGELIPIGDPNLEPLEIAYTYLRSLSTLDFAVAQRYADRTNTLKTINKYYANSDDSDFSYDSQFKKDMYKQVLLSIKPLNVVNTATFAEYKTSITIEVEILDLSNKDFWRADDLEIYEHLRSYKKGERDTTKAKTYLYDYVLNYWKSETPLKKKIEVSLLMESTPDGGWIITDDSSLDSYAKYADGETVVNNILINFERWLNKQS